MSVPVLFAVDEDERGLRAVERELVDRYSRGYRVVCVPSENEAMAQLEWGSWGDGQTAGEIFEAMARRHIEYDVIRPSQSPDELFHQSVLTSLTDVHVWALLRRRQGLGRRATEVAIFDLVEHVRRGAR